MLYAGTIQAQDPGTDRKRAREAFQGAFGHRRPEFFPQQANYLLVRMDRGLQPASSLKQEIFKRDRILIRDCGSFEGLDDWYFRVAVRLPDQNDRLIAAIKNSI